MIIGGLRISPHCMQPTTGMLTMWHTSYSQTVAECDPIRGVQCWQAPADLRCLLIGKEGNVPSEPTMTSILRSSLGHLPLVTMIPHCSSSYAS